MNTNRFPTPPEGGQKPTGKRWFMLSLIFVLTAINYLDRTNMAVAAPSMSAELGFSAATMGMLLSAFAWAYALMQVPGGYFLERVGPRITYTISLFLWSLFTMIMGLGNSFLSLFGIRLAIGAAESPAFPTNSRVVAAWFPDHERATATSIYTAAEFIGLAFLTPVLFWILDTFGWREVFYITGIIGIGVSAIWYWLYRDPKDCQGVNQAELDYIRQGGGQAEEAGTSKKDYHGPTQRTVSPSSAHRHLYQPICQHEHDVFLFDLVPDILDHGKKSSYVKSRDLCHHPLFRRPHRCPPRRSLVRSHAEERRFFIEGQKAAHCLRLDLLHVDHGGELL